MIITSDPDVKDVDQLVKGVEQLNIVANRAAVPDDPPPAYFDPNSNSTSKSQPLATEPPLPPLPPPSSSTAAGPFAPPSVKPTNFLSLSRGNSSIKGTYVIDPSMTIPPFLLPPLAPDETEGTRRNAFLHTSNGAIDVDLFVVGGNGDGDVRPKGKVQMLLRSSNGGISARLHASAAARSPINFAARSSNGSINIRVPRTFRGPVTVRTKNGSMKFMGDLGAAVTTFNEVNGTHRAFIGDFSDWTGGMVGDSKGEDAWTGDEITVETSNGGVRFQFDGADSQTEGGEGKEGKSKSGFFGKLWGN
ncbi:hypothetical protein DFH07DRAFT_960953 [Mycena maculata]|uniref:DUF7330 domain-containing protein n=1 Tax=Mycena maculata TaxID=230809 RepID=A0AAD7N9M1_9AGAR|nr:hypothetical protein DFH07DRAFT_960953 [Mycena maculata]